MASADPMRVWGLVNLQSTIGKGTFSFVVSDDRAMSAAFNMVWVDLNWLNLPVTDRENGCVRVRERAHVFVLVQVLVGVLMSILVPILILILISIATGAPWCWKLDTSLADSAIAATARKHWEENLVIFNLPTIIEWCCCCRLLLVVVDCLLFLLLVVGCWLPVACCIFCFFPFSPRRSKIPIFCGGGPFRIDDITCTKNRNLTNKQCHLTFICHYPLFVVFKFRLSSCFYRMISSTGIV